MDAELKAANIEYASKRASGRLGRALLALVPPGSFEQLRHSRARQDAQYKEIHLTLDPEACPRLAVYDRL